MPSIRKYMNWLWYIDSRNIKWYDHFGKEFATKQIATSSNNSTLSWTSQHLYIYTYYLIHTHARACAHTHTVKTLLHPRGIKEYVHKNTGIKNVHSSFIYNGNELLVHTVIWTSVIHKTTETLYQRKAGTN